MSASGSSAPSFSLEQQIACVEREIGMRERVYPRWVNSRPPKLTQKKADEELGAMRAVLGTLNHVRNQEAAKVQRRPVEP